MMRGVALLGATGSIGASALDVVGHHPERDGGEGARSAIAGSHSLPAPAPERLPCVRVAYAARAAGAAPIVMDAAREFAVSAFLGGRARYPAIAATCARMQDRIAATDVESIGAALAIDARVRREACAMLGPPQPSTSEALAA